MLDVLQAMGYGGCREDAAERLGQSGDEGVDGIIREDRLGLDQIYVQAKKWADPVGRPEIQKFFGALHGQRATKGVFITTSSFSRGAREFANDVTPRVILSGCRQVPSVNSTGWQARPHCGHGNRAPVRKPSRSSTRRRAKSKSLLTTCHGGSSCNASSKSCFMLRTGTPSVNDRAWYPP